MIPLIEENRDAIADLCRQYGVQKLAVFGSAVAGTWDPVHSDLDFAVDLGEYERGVSRRFLRFYTGIQELFDPRRVDIVTLHPHLSDAFRHELNATAVTIHGFVPQRSVNWKSLAKRLMRRVGMNQHWKSISPTCRTGSHSVISSLTSTTVLICKSSGRS